MSLRENNRDLNLTVKRLFEVYPFKFPIHNKQLKRKYMIEFQWWSTYEETIEKTALKVLENFENHLLKYFPKEAKEVYVTRQSFFRLVTRGINGDEVVVLDNKEDTRIIPCPIATYDEKSLRGDFNSRICSGVVLCFDKGTKSLKPDWNTDYFVTIDPLMTDDCIAYTWIPNRRVRA